MRSSFLPASCLLLLLPSLLMAQEVHVDRGQHTFMRICYPCHGLSPTDGGRIAPTVGTRDLLSFSTGLWNQSRVMMGAFRNRHQSPPHLKREEMIDLFLFTQIVADRTEAGDPELGRRFVRANDCLTCHSIAGQGGQVAIAWDSLANVLHPTHIMSAIWGHRLHMIQAFRDRGLPLPRFRPNDLANLIAYIRQSGRTDAVSPLLVDLKEIRIHPASFRLSRCNDCHQLNDFRAAPGRSVQQISESILGHAFRPEFQRPPYSALTLSEQQATDLVTLISYYGHLGRPGNPARGREVFEAQLCAQCHLAPGESGKEGDRLGISPLRDQWDLALRVFNKASRIVQKPGMEGRAFPRLTTAEMADLYAYLKGSAGPGPAGARHPRH